jgi:hypothetical protein
LRIGGKQYSVNFIVSDMVDEILLSLEFMRDLKACWKFDQNTIVIDGQCIKLHSKTSTDYIRRVFVNMDMKLQPNSMADIPVNLKYTSLSVPKCDTYLMEPTQYNDSVIMPRSIIGIGTPCPYD